MIKKSILKAINYSLIISFLLLVPTIAPLYLITGLLAKHLAEKTK